MKKLFSNVRKEVGHAFPLPGEDYIRSDLGRNAPKVSSLLQSLEAVFLCIVNESDGTFSGETELQAFCNHHMQEGESLGILSLDKTNLKSTKLKHLICLFELLEDICSDLIVHEGSEAIPGCYRDDQDSLTQEMQQE